MLTQKLKTLRAMPAVARGEAFEAAFFLGLARLAVLVLPFRVIAKAMQRAPDNDETSDEGRKDAVKAVKNAVAIAAKNVPWNAVCLPQAIAAKAMLARRGYGSAFHFGAGSNADGKLFAHAWLAVGGTIVVGGDGIDDVAPLIRLG